MQIVEREAASDTIELAVDTVLSRLTLAPAAAAAAAVAPCDVKSRCHGGVRTHIWSTVRRMLWSMVKFHISKLS